MWNQRATGIFFRPSWRDYELGGPLPGWCGSKHTSGTTAMSWQIGQPTSAVSLRRSVFTGHTHPSNSLPWRDERCSAPT
eukprot:2167884-Rhodomonas_salina.1